LAGTKLWIAIENTQKPKTSRFERHMPPSSSEPASESRRYPRKVSFSTDDSSAKREPVKLGRSESSVGVASPSDPRRLHDQPEHAVNTPRTYKIAGYDVSAETFANFNEWQNRQQAGFHRKEELERSSKATKTAITEEDVAQKNEPLSPEEVEHRAWRDQQPKETVPGELSPSGRTKAEVLGHFQTPEALDQRKKPYRQDALARETDFISEFLNDSPSTRNKEVKISAATQGISEDKEWKQTALDRRAGNTFPSRAKSDFTSSIRARQRRLAALHNNMPTKIRVEPSETSIDTAVGSYAASEVEEPSTSKAAAQDRHPLRLNETKPQATDSEHSTKPTHTRSTSQVLSQLPKDDIDFLSAADIRAAMGAKKAQDEAAKSRAELEKDFKETHANEMEIDPVIESKIVNDKYIRRLERDLKAKQEAKAAAHETASSESIIETSFNSLTKLIQDGGECFTKYLWADPVDADRSTKRSWDPMLVDIVQTLRQNRESLREISHDLENDLPTTKHLLKGLRDFESRAIGSVVSLARYRDRPEGADGTELRKKHNDAIESLKLINYQPEMLKQLEHAFQVIDSMGTVKISEEMQERLQIAETVLKGNADSTRTIWRALLRAHNTDRPRSEPLIRVFRYHMGAVSNFQASLLNVVQRFLHRLDMTRLEGERNSFNTSSFSGAVAGTRSEEVAAFDTSKKLSAANQALEAEIKAQKDAMCGLSDDGYRRAPKPAPAPAPIPEPTTIRKKTPNELKPLVNSLFRPFGLQLESLGREEEVVAQERKIEAQKSKEKIAKDGQQVMEARKKNDDSHGAVAAEVAVQETEQVLDGWPTIIHSASKETTSTPAANERVADKENAILTLAAKASNFFLREPEEATPSTKNAPSTVTLASVEKQGMVTLEEHNHDNVEKTNAKSPSFTEQFLGAPAIDGEPLQNCREETVVKSAPTPYISLAANVPETTREPPPPPPPAPITYKILTYNKSNDELSITTTTANIDHVADAVQLPEALLALDHPEKFTPHLPEGYEVTKAKNDMLVMRSSAGAKLQTETVRFKNVSTESISESSSNSKAADSNTPVEPLHVRYAKYREARLREYLELNHGVTKTNGIWVNKDGSPVADSALEVLRLKPKQLGKDSSKIVDDMAMRRDMRKRRSMGLAKTVVWAGAGCYALGVLGELLA
jgi:hypothetical protein